jgi:hypothetical protein
MKTERIWELVTCSDPLEPLIRHLTAEIWTPEAFAEAADDPDEYLKRGEQAESKFEGAVYGIYSDVYGQLEGPHPLKRRIEDEVLGLDEFTLVIFDALSLREVPAVLDVFAEFNIEVGVSHSLSCVPSETVEFAQEHFNVGGPSAIGTNLPSPDLAYRHVKKQDWQPDFSPDERRRLIWALYPDNTFNLDHGAISYGQHVIEPVQDILRAVLAADPVLPLVVTSDHGYIWQGGTAFWAVQGEEERVLASHFKGGRLTRDATVQLVTSTGGKAWVSGQTAAARGRFAWGGKVKGATKLYKHGGVSLMECVVPWVTMGATDEG